MAPGTIFPDHSEHPSREYGRLIAGGIRAAHGDAPHSTRALLARLSAQHFSVLSDFNRKLNKKQA